ncbi:tigger transposable element-derived protein 1-like [Centruroides sculpturatus]|uniref:tigger transposable element-derived protein 1-like n=1 Tax=Centruroides sculpturatus TaxID=218467 RepID=UPI000C6D43AB|nr:tigger transposable element-derived protein 1-like [Centruroides sculpturatus]
MGQSSPDETSVKFVASNGWFEKFKKRHSLHNIHIQGEKASADEDAAKKYPAELADIIQTKGYLADQVFNADETGLSWEKMPSRTYISKNEKTAPGFKVSKDRITLLLCSNASGDFITKPMLIHRSLNPCSMKQCNNYDLPVYWRDNKKAWMTGHLFKNWFHNCFVPDVENYLKKKNLAFKVLLILDNAPSHPIDLNHSNVEIAFLPGNTTSLLQPLDQGIIAAFKSYYIRKSFELILEKINSTDITVSEVWKQFSILNCVEVIGSSLKEIRQSTLNASWKALLLEMVSQENVVEPIQREYDNIVSLAHAIGGDGFTEITVDDILELVTENEINEADLVTVISETLAIEDNFEDLFNEEIKNFTPKGIEKRLDMAKQMESYFLENDPLPERAELFKRNLQNCLSAYQEIYKDLQSKSKQSLMTDFLKPKPTGSAMELVDETSSDLEIRPVKRSRTTIIGDDED